MHYSLSVSVVLAVTCFFNSMSLLRANLSLFRSPFSRLIPKRFYIAIDDFEPGDDKDFPKPKAVESYPLTKKIKGRFVSPWDKDAHKSLATVLKYVISSKQNKLKMPDNSCSSTMLYPVPVNKAKLAATNKPHFTWLGHATCYYQTNGIYFLTDPVFSERASFVQFFGPKRFVPAPIEVEQLTVDVVLISHTHYDHLDAGSVKRIGNKPLWIVPSGLKSWLASMGVTNCVEMEWWQTYTYLKADGTTADVTFTPTKHWTARTFFDRNKCLWGSYSVVTPKSRFFFTGDTSYCDVFQRVGAKYGPFDLAAVPIGAYAPRWFMQHVHNNPEEALQIHRDLRAKQSVGIHWGTFPLADEDPIEPALELGRVRDVKQVSAKDFFTMAHGETVELGSASLYDLATTRSDLYGIYLDSLRGGRNKDLLTGTGGGIPASPSKQSESK